MESNDGSHPKANSQDWEVMKRYICGLLLFLVGCAVLGGRPGNRKELTDVVGDVLHQLDLAGEIVWVGLRDTAGKETASTLAIEEYILSGLVREGVSFSISESVPSTWPDGLIPWEEGASAGQVLGGQLAEDGLWAYLRLSLVDGVQGDRLKVAVRGVEMRYVEDEVAQRARADGKGDEGLPIGVELHWVVLRSEGDIRRPVELREESTLREGDQIQVRFRLNRDAQVYAFLFSSEGERISLVTDEYRYSGLPYYGPGENSWVTMTEPDRVYTAYFMVGSRLLEENATEFFERLDELVEQRQVDRFVGLEKQDATLVDFLQRSFVDALPIRVMRSMEDVTLGRVETFVYGDGTRIQSAAEKWNAPVIVRALSFSVQ